MLLACTSFQPHLHKPQPTQPKYFPTNSTIALSNLPCFSLILSTNSLCTVRYPPFTPFPPPSSAFSHFSSTANKKDTSSILVPAADSPFPTISPTSHTATPRPNTSPSSFTTTRLDCCDHHICSEGSNRSQIDGNAFIQPTQNSAFPLASCPPTLQATEAAPPAEPKASPKAPHRTHTQHLHTAPPAEPQHIPAASVAPSVTTSFDFHTPQPPLDIVHHCCRCE
ncbi:uncharacterized protein MONOS_3661 [Monocercomonoides exilis]|uniref:uncharacterized protein n=1 Tax=Monocercomonoides exilis TaxID=2049356 RepID=UPI00355A26FC|nr:hypothetical protein MONOS_3661 [Monocercomonoides exilis]|eukprot:MONOS_3661.1-p1 / transcript=MONOS_3661.1 / gene=MONOS_3661 / organism=Monocercomonoides_exilis_PA203 / gene_product=unspecified product / transcript_product=unspecified product / location=Mono_scaffold00088:74264-74935(+) / protein_length=224 / sequence_SO=supercontig / SO=protein_coding / is_pseudo=false